MYSVVIRLTLLTRQAISFGFLDTLDIGNVLLVLLYIRLRIRSNYLTIIRFESLYFITLSRSLVSFSFLPGKRY
jgi:hypothetical protein